MNRRNFILKSSLVSAALLAQRSCLSLVSKREQRMGYQLYSIRDEMEINPFGTLDLLSSIGYNDFEVHGYDPHSNLIYGVHPKEFISKITDLNANVSSGHYGFNNYLHKPIDDLHRFIDACIMTAKTLKSKYIVYPWLAPDQREVDDFKKVAEHLNIIGEKTNAANLSCAYHNHDFEFHDQDGISGYEILLNETDPSMVKMQMDIYWVMHSSPKTPKQWIEEYPGRFPMWHIKDMEKQTRDFTELGKGTIDYKHILPDPKQCSLEYFFIEQDGNYTENSKESAKTSALYFNENLREKIDISY